VAPPQRYCGTLFLTGGLLRQFELTEGIKISGGNLKELLKGQAEWHEQPAKSTKRGMRGGFSDLRKVAFLLLTDWARGLLLRSFLRVLDVGSWIQAEAIAVVI